MRIGRIAMSVVILGMLVWSHLLGHLAGAGQESEHEEPFNVLETSYRAGDIEFAATLLMPVGATRCAAAVLIQGAGDSSRKNVWALMIGQVLAREGIVVLAPDKRGTGDTGGDWREASFEDLARDVRAAVEFLAARPEVDPDAVGVIGLSQGGFYAPLVARTSNKVAFVGAVSSSVLPFEQTVNHEMQNTFRQQGLTGTDYEQAMALQRAAIRFTRDGNWRRYEAVRTKTLEGSAAESASGFPATAEDRLWSWIRKVVDFDPLPHWKRVSQPIFFAFGEADETDNVPVTASLARIKSELEPRLDVTVRTYAGSGHGLWDPTRAEEGERTIHEGFAKDLVAWIQNSLERSR